MVTEWWMGWVLAKGYILPGVLIPPLVSLLASPVSSISL